MAIIDDYVPADVLTGFVRTVPQPANLVLNRFLPDRQIGNVEAAIEQLTKKNRVARFRAYDAETHISRRDSFQRSRIKLPPLGSKLPIAEQEHLMLQVVSTGGDNRNQYVNAIYDDAATLSGEVRNRMELARADVLQDGKFSLTGENNLTLEADFGVPSGNIVTAGTVWSDHANATPLQNYKSWVDTYIDVNGEAPGVSVTSNTVVGNLLLSGEIRELFTSQTLNAGGPNLITRLQLNQVLQAYGLPPVFEYNTKLEALDGTDQRVIPDNLFIMLPSDPTSLGYTAWGITGESLVLATGQNPRLTFEDLPGLVGVVMTDGDPVQTWTKVSAVGMPLLTDPKRLFVADVL